VRGTCCFVCGVFLVVAVRALLHDGSLSGVDLHPLGRFDDFFQKSCGLPKESAIVEGSADETAWFAKADFQQKGKKEISPKFDGT
jgi:hypothetical protein